MVLSAVSHSDGTQLFSSRLLPSQHIHQGCKIVLHDTRTAKPTFSMTQSVIISRILVHENFLFCGNRLGTISIWDIRKMTDTNPPSTHSPTQQSAYVHSNTPTAVDGSLSLDSSQSFKSCKPICEFTVSSSCAVLSLGLSFSLKHFYLFVSTSDSILRVFRLNHSFTEATLCYSAAGHDTQNFPLQADMQSFESNQKSSDITRPPKWLLDWRASTRQINNDPIIPPQFQLVSGSADGSVYIYHCRNGNRVAEVFQVLQSHSGPVYSSLFHPVDPNILFTGGSDGLVRVLSSSNAK